MRLLTALIEKLLTPPIPSFCPECRAERPLVRVGPVRLNRWVCPQCATEFGAVQDEAGDWHYSTAGIPVKRRRRRLSA